MSRAVPTSDRGSATLDLVLNTSIELFAERGYAAATMRQLADRANLPLSAFYYYFHRKYDVLLAIMDAVMGRLEAAAEDASDESLSPSDQLMSLVEAHVRIHLDHPAAAMVADGELRALSPDDLNAAISRRDAYEARFRRVLDAGIRGGEFPAELDVPIASIAILTMSTGVVNWWRPRGRYTKAETGRILGRLALGLARAKLEDASDQSPAVRREDGRLSAAR